MSRLKVGMHKIKPCTGNMLWIRASLRRRNTWSCCILTTNPRWPWMSMVRLFRASLEPILALSSNSSSGRTSWGLLAERSRSGFHCREYASLVQTGVSSFQSQRSLPPCLPLIWRHPHYLDEPCLPHSAPTPAKNRQEILWLVQGSMKMCLSRTL